MGGHTFVNEKAVHIVEKNKNIAVNFETKDEGDLSYMHLRLINRTNIQSEIIDKSTIISTRIMIKTNLENMY